MIPEVVSHLSRADAFLERARRLNADQDWELAAFAAYTAGFHAAQALVLQQTGNSPKTHTGMNSLLNSVSLELPELDNDLARRFGKHAATRHAAVYGAERVIDAVDARDILDWAERLTAGVRGILGAADDA